MLADLRTLASMQRATRRAGGHVAINQRFPNLGRVGTEAPAAVLNIAHRGARAFAPENTLASCKRAASFDCQMVEIDVQMSRDGELIIHHDDELIRCTNAREIYPGRISYFLSDFTADELLRLDAGSWYVNELLLPSRRRQPFLRTLTTDEISNFLSPQERAWYASGEIKLPTLRQVLQFALDAQILVNIELKMNLRTRPGLAEAVVALVETMGVSHRVLISSFDHTQLRIVRRLSDAIATGVLTQRPLASPVEYLRSLDADAYHPRCDGAFDSVGSDSTTVKTDRLSIRAVRAAGFGVNVWTCNDPGQVTKLISAGVTGVITDFPNRLRDVCLNGGSNAGGDND
jgi:glycerophosphoryl diester phosphodiesterase